MITGKELINEYYESEKLYSTGNDDLDNLLERAFCEGYEYAQYEFSKKDEDEDEEKIKKRKKRLIAASAGASLGILGGAIDYSRHIDNPKHTDSTGETMRYNTGLGGWAEHRKDQVKDRVNRVGSRIGDWFNSDDGVATRADKYYRKAIKDRKPTADINYEEMINRNMRSDAVNKARRVVKAGRIAKVVLPTAAVIGGGIALYKHNKKKKEQQEEENKKSKK